MFNSGCTLRESEANSNKYPCIYICFCTTCKLIGNARENFYKFPWEKLHRLPSPLTVPRPRIHLSWMKIFRVFFCKIHKNKLYFFRFFIEIERESAVVLVLVIRITFIHHFFVGNRLIIVFIVCCRFIFLIFSCPCRCRVKNLAVRWPFFCGSTLLLSSANLWFCVKPLRSKSLETFGNWRQVYRRDPWKKNET